MRKARSVGCGWEFCFNQPPELARRLVEVGGDGQTPHWFEKVRRGAPASSNAAEYLLAEDGWRRATRRLPLVKRLAC